MLIHRQNWYAPSSKRRTGRREAQSLGLGPRTKNPPCILPQWYNDSSYQHLTSPASKEHWPTVTCLSSGALPNSLLYTIFTAEACFDVWGWREASTTALQSFAGAKACCITIRRIQGSLNRGADLANCSSEARNGCVDGNKYRYRMPKLSTVWRNYFGPLFCPKYVFISY